MIRFASFVFTLGILVPAASAVTYPLPPEGSRLVGAPITITVPEGNTLPLEAFAAQHGQGLSNMLEANPGGSVFTASRNTAGGTPAAYSAANGARGDCGERRGNATLLLSTRQQHG